MEILFSTLVVVAVVALVLFVVYLLALGKGMGRW